MRNPIVFLGYLFALFNLHAQESAIALRLNETQFLQKVLEENPGLLSVEAGLESAVSRRKEALSPQNFTVELSAGQSGLQSSFMQRLRDPLTLHALKLSLDASGRESIARLFYQRGMLIASVRRRFSALRALDGRLKLVEEKILLLDQYAAQLARLTAGGLPLEDRLLRIQGDRVELRRMAVELESRIEATRIELAAMLPGSYDELEFSLIKVRAGLPSGETLADLQQALLAEGSFPALELASVSRIYKDAARFRAGGSLFPDLSAGLMVSSDYTNNSLRAMLMMDLPLTAARSVFALKAAKGEQESAALAYSQAELEVKKELQLQLNAARSLERQLELIEKEERPLTREALELSASALGEADSGSFLLLLDNFRRLIGVDSKLLQLEQAYETVWLQLEQLTGLTLDEMENMSDEKIK